MFKKAKQTRTFQDVVDQIQDAVLAGKILQGEKLPAERILKENFRVSRGTLREALRVLEQKGLIEIRLGVGGGAFVREAATSPASESLALLLRRHGASTKDLSEFRKNLESEIAALAAKRANDADLEDLKSLLAEMEKSLSDPFDSEHVLEVDHLIHLALGKITGNRVYRTIQTTIHENIEPYFDRYVPRNIETLTGNYDDLCRVAEAIGKKDAEKAREAMRKHLERYEIFINGE